MRIAVPIILALIVVGGLGYGCYELWLLLNQQIRGTFLANFKFFPAVIATFLVLSAADYLLGWIERRFIVSRGKDRAV